MSKPAEEKVLTCPKGLVHRGFFHERTNYDQSYPVNRRETAFARAWEAENTLAGKGFRISGSDMEGLLDLLMTKQSVGRGGLPRIERVGTYDQNAAHVAATVVQWLGSNIGFAFLTQTLEKAGFQLTAIKDKQARRVA